MSECVSLSLRFEKIFSYKFLLIRLLFRAAFVQPLVNVHKPNKQSCWKTKRAYRIYTVVGMHSMLCCIISATNQTGQTNSSQNLYSQKSNYKCLTFNRNGMELNANKSVKFVYDASKYRLHQSLHSHLILSLLFSSQLNREFNCSYSLGGDIDFIHNCILHIRLCFDHRSIIKMWAMSICVACYSLLMLLLFFVSVLHSVPTLVVESQTYNGLKCT